MGKKGQKGVESLLNFLNASPTAWHAVSTMCDQLEQAGFQHLQEGNKWSLQRGGKYFVTRNGSSLCAFIVPTSPVFGSKIILTHTDSPGFKLKPNGEFRKENMIMFGVEMYGSPLITSWLNRDLGIAGRIIYADSHKDIRETLVNLEDNPVILPQLAIHLDRQVNESGLTLNKQEHLAVLASLVDETTLRESYLQKLIRSQCPFDALLSYDLFLYPLERAKFIGNDNQMIASYRIDNLCSVYASLSALLEDPTAHADDLKLIAALDHEEIGSETAQGAGSPFVQHVMERISLSLNLSREDYLRLINNSFCISSDSAHATHPNYPDRHDPRHPIHMQRGIVIKYNAQQKYATDARSASIIIALCKKYNLPYQQFVTRGDIPCGSTVGPIHAHKSGMTTVDIGIPQLSMHSCREITSSQDFLDLCTLLKGFFNT